jgi:hypothetical protein
MNVLLHVEKEKGVEVTFEPSLNDCFPNTNNGTTSELGLIPVSITSYSKEENVLNGSIGRMKMKISSVPKGFCQYLYDRKKAGVISYHKSLLYVLPPKNREDDYLFCITATPAPNTLKDADSVAPAETQIETTSTSSSSATKSSGAATAPKVEKQASEGKKGDDFLSSLLSKVWYLQRTLETALSLSLSFSLSYSIFDLPAQQALL